MATLEGEEEWRQEEEEMGAAELLASALKRMDGLIGDYK